MVYATHGLASDSESLASKSLEPISGLEARGVALRPMAGPAMLGWCFTVLLVLVW